MKAIEGGKKDLEAKERDWRQEVYKDIEDWVGFTVEKFKTNMGRSFSRAPLVELHADVFRGYSGALVDTMFHLFGGAVGIDLDMESNLIQDLQERFKKARQDELEKKLKKTDLIKET